MHRLEDLPLAARIAFEIMAKALNTTKLVRVERMVTRKGKSYMTHLWVKPNQVKASDTVIHGAGLLEAPSAVGEETVSGLAAMNKLRNKQKKQAASRKAVTKKIPAEKTTDNTASAKNASPKAKSESGKTETSRPQGKPSPAKETKPKVDAAELKKLKKSVADKFKAAKEAVKQFEAKRKKAEKPSQYEAQEELNAYNKQGALPSFALANQIKTFSLGVAKKIVSMMQLTHRAQALADEAAAALAAVEEAYQTQSEAIEKLAQSDPETAKRWKDETRFADPKFSEAYRETLSDRFERLPASARRAFDKYVGDVTLSIGAYVKLDKINSCYAPELDSIFFRLKNDERGLEGDKRTVGQTLFHECGHVIDNRAKGGGKTVSNDAVFLAALREDAKRALNAKRTEIEKMFAHEKVQPELMRAMTDIALGEDIMKDGTAITAAIQDLMEGSLGGMFDGVKYGHGSAYWLMNKKDNTPKTDDEIDEMLGTEAFANMFEAYSSPEGLAPMKKWFPNATARFEELLEQIGA